MFLYILFMCVALVGFLIFRFLFVRVELLLRYSCSVRIAV